MADSFPHFMELIQEGDKDQVAGILEEHPHWLDGRDKYYRPSWFPIMQAANVGRDAIIELLVALGSKTLNGTNREGGTPMHYAAAGGYISTVELLVRLGSNCLDTRDYHGCTPLYYAAAGGHPDMVELFGRLGSKAVDIPDEYGKTPLHMAVIEGYAAVVEMLVVGLGSKCLDTPDRIGQTPLRYAINNEDIPNIELLVSLGCCISPSSTYIDDSTYWSLDMVILLKALGFDVPIFEESLNSQRILDTRYRVYFSRSLTSRLLLKLQA